MNLLDIFASRPTARRTPCGLARISLATIGLVVAVLSAPAVPHAQVMEIGDGGSVKMYDGPAVTNDQGSTPIPAYRRRPRRAGEYVVDRAMISDAADASALSPDLVAAVAWRESGFRPGVASRAGAVGEMQLMPGTARALGVDPMDSRQNVRGGAAYLSGLMARYKGDLVRTLAAYNAGPGAVDRYGGVPPFKETQAYVAAIMDRLSRVAVDSALGNSGLTGTSLSGPTK